MVKVLILDPKTRKAKMVRGKIKDGQIVVSSFSEKLELPKPEMGFFLKKLFWYEPLFLYLSDGRPLVLSANELSPKEKVYRELLKLKIFKQIGLTDREGLYYGICIGFVLAIIFLEMVLPLLGINITIGR